ncbi:uncharacterized protein LOC127860067 isoform X2 [Dreissena polymorpha]|uniref:Mab-21-like HhH/H2TH-like domain-containing protein n=2 Tax=Dreissena polymorpha TaxID=45954 RepID=A0A9D4BNH5_DREPO|nr:uncharacterized protein LOC127860067 isoform X2 [Dreissena polymorpha]XP_052253803.1 uncharacterized protein LOC127860067 isoform X2 [Dreissena polymorpha]XP_052253804.1 uncharacterized protein LOC127860067 isoform X2 [Dreissena polymorpha]XP_052253805.1 uncharacterized protein LOC127860067 isoform X2 [Dreissena polymorpha]XP_052253806.1 uncharacterized protein LOC127860067 isoform X2 [Dreissena polymorpha]XP_052253807.1 uncharacterized protein LOC127860067 isoform X2 [Dreissena polymorpha]
MNKDGEWGDHIVIHALACFLKTPVTIYGCDEKGMIRPRPEIIAGKHKQNSTVYLGHIYGAHYISLRPQTWKEDLLKVLGGRSDSCVISGRNSDPGVAGTGGDVPDMYLSFAMMYCLKQQIIQPLVQQQIHRITNFYRLYNLCTDHSDALYVGILGSNQETRSFKEDLFIIPLETVVDDDFTSSELHKRNQLKAVRQENGNTINLVPEKPENWMRCLNQEHFLHHLQIPSDMMDSPRWIAFQTKMPNTERWLERSRRHGWPPNRAIYDLLTGDGFLVVPEPKCSKYAWKYDFRLAEDILLAKAFTDYQKDCFKIMKILLDQTQVSQYLPYVCVKHAFYYQCQETPANVWKSDPTLCLRSLIGRFISNINDACFPNFFDSTLNLMPNKLSPDERSQVNQGLFIAQKHTFVCLCNAFSTPATDFEDRWSRAFAAMFHRLVESMPSSDTERVLEECFIPTAVAGIQELVERERFSLAYERCTEAVEELNHVCKAELAVNYIVNLVVCPASYNVRHWLFAFYVAFVTGHYWFDEVNKDLDSVILVDVFGENLYQILEDTFGKKVSIPTHFIEPERICQTTLALAKVLEQCDIYQGVIANVELAALDYVIIQLQNCTSTVRVLDINIEDNMRELQADVRKRINVMDDQRDRKLMEIANIRKEFEQYKRKIIVIDNIRKELRKCELQNDLTGMKLIFSKLQDINME